MQTYKITLRRVLIVMQETTQSIEARNEEDATLRAMSVEDSAWRTLDSDMVALDTPANLTFQNYKSMEVRNAQET